jgi:6,7-dimethyl-8-ribityllumazine synthase
VALIAKKLAETRRYNAIICLAAVIRGGTPHFEYVASQITRDTSRVGLEAGLPVIFGVITADTLEEAIERAGTKMGNKGFQAAVSAIEMANLVKGIS